MDKVALTWDRSGECVKRALKRMVDGTPLGPLARIVWSKVHRPTSPDGRNELYDRQTVDVMKKVLEPSSDCIDIGAFKGDFLRVMVGLAPGGRHYAFEPLPHLAQALRERYPSVEVIEAALSDRPGRRRFRHVQGAEGYSGFFRRPYDTYEENVSTIDVDVVRLDDVLPEQIHPRFVKIDVEGGGRRRPSQARLKRYADRSLSSRSKRAGNPSRAMTSSSNSAVYGFPS